jgi:hypothetical protein
MVCGHIEIRLLNLKTLGRYFDDELIINAVQALAPNVTRPKLTGGSIRPCSMNGMK